MTTAASSWAVSLTVASGAVALAAALGRARRVLLAGGAILAPFWLSLLVMHGLFYPEGRTVLAGWGPARVTAEGLGFAVDMGLRTSAFVLVLMLFSFSVRVPDLVAALATLRLPPQFGYVLASTLMLAPIIAARLHTVRQAQESRGLVVEKGLGSRLRAVRLQMVPLVLGLVHDAGTRAQALDARGFRRAGPRTSYRRFTIQLPSGCSDGLSSCSPGQRWSSGSWHPRPAEALHEQAGDERTERSPDNTVRGHRRVHFPRRLRACAAGG